MPLTYGDIKQIEGIFDRKFDERFNLLPTKDEFFTWMDRIYGELMSIRQEMAIMGARTTRVTERVDQIERKLKISSN